MRAMGTTIYVRDYLGEKLMQGAIDMQSLLAAAEAHDLPLLAGVDLYDDTTFNRKQSVRLKNELDRLSVLGEYLEEAIASLLEATALVSARPHRYLVFNGD